MNDIDTLRERLAELQLEHRDLDVMSRLSEAGTANQLQVQRLKKRKLMLRDMIARLESQILPDIIA